MAKAKAKSKKVNAAPILLRSYPYTFEQLHWGERMLHYIANDLEIDYNKLASMHTYLLTKRNVPDLFQAFYKWVDALAAQYELKDAMEIFDKRFRDCTSPCRRDPFNESTGEMMRLAFHATFPGKTLHDALHFSKFCLDVQFRDGGLENVYFEAYSDEEAFDAIIQAYLEQDETLPDDKFWKPTGLSFLSKSGNRANISQVFFAHSAGIVPAPKPAMSADARAFVDKATDHPGVVGKAKPQNPPDDKDEDGYPLPFDESVISTINNIAKELFNDIDNGTLDEIAKEIALNG